jgi:energy-coupling factor transport system ATP-binding protein
MARAGDDVAFGLENLGVPAGQIWPRVDDALTQATFPYGRDRRTDALSGGEQQRLALAGVLALDPTLVLLDEPTTNLDPTGADLVRKAIAELRDRTLILVEHRVAEALHLVDRIVVLAEGSVRADGDPSSVLAQHGTQLAAAGVWVPGLPSTPRHATGPRGDLLLRGRSLSYRYPGGTATAPADLDAYAGEALALHGPSGAGKSTLLLMLGGLLKPTTGTLSAPGTTTPPYRWRAPALTARIGTVFQNPRHQFLAATVRDELALGPRRAGHSNVDRTVDDLLDRLHLTHLAAANPHTLSGGEQRRLSVATVLAAAPTLLLLDEPTFGQDRRTWLELLDLFAALRDEGRGIVAATHDTDFAAALADRTVHLAAA